MGEYRAPGVYVEEIPSAQQPIAGVGTNTVGFIGLVPDIIYCPEPNPAYDPVVAQAALRLAELRAAASTTQAEIDAATRPLTREVENLQRDHDNLVAQRPTLVTAEENARTALNNAQTAAQTARNNAQEGDDISRLDAAVHSATLALDKAQADLSDLDSQIQTKLDNINDLTSTITGPAPAGPAPAGPAPAGPAPAGPAPRPVPEQEPDDSARLLRQSVLKPYVLKPFPVHEQVEPYDTKLCTNFTEYTNRFGPFSADDPDFIPTPTEEARPISPEHRALTHAVNGFFKNGGTRCFVARVDPRHIDIERVLEAFESIDELAIIAAPGLREEDLPNAWDNLATFCEGRENCFAILDSHADLGDEHGFLDVEKLSYANPRSLLPGRNRNAAFYVPHLEVVDPAKQLQDEDPIRKVDPKYKGRVYVPPSGHIAGIYARTDEERGVHKAPANTPVLGALNVAYYISKPKQELLNPQGVNCIRTMNGNITVWGARTVGGDKNGEWKYINVRRLFLFLRKSIDEGTQWVVFEPNDPTLWGKIRRNLTAFLTNVWRSGALFGLTPEEAFYVKCDAETNPPEVRDLGQVITEVGVAIVRPAEFVIFRVTQATGPRTS